MIPKYEEIMLPALELLGDGQERAIGEIRSSLAQRFGLSDEEKKELLPSGQQPVFSNRVSWAVTYLKKAGLLVTPRRAHSQISEEGKLLLKDKPSEINREFLKRYKPFVEFITNTKSTDSSSTSIAAIGGSQSSPEEELEYAYQALVSGLSSELLSLVKSCSPDFFEQLVVDLLIAMGYGGSRKEAGKALGKSGDGGVDGVISEDRLGLDLIYLQAKRWENVVPVKEVRDFIGALAGKKAKKGVFITTSGFPSGAYEHVEKVDYRIILIDGERLTKLMIEHGVGVSSVSTYHVKTIDSDYFEGG